MAIEIHKPEKPVVVEKISADWLLAAGLWMQLFTIGPDRLVLLSQDEMRSCYLKTTQNPKTNNIDTVGRIEIHEGKEVAEVINLDENNPFYICATQTPHGIEVEQVIQYKPFHLIQNS